MNGDALYSIGELARKSGITVKTIRFYSDRGIVSPTDRSPAGYRLYGDEAVARLDLVRTLRDLGLDLTAIRKIMDRELALPEVAAAHAEALDVQIRVLRLRRAVLTAVAQRRATPEETHLMHKLAQLTEVERRRLVEGFLDSVFADVEAAGFASVRCSMTPELPENPGPEQVQAWVELAELSQDTDFRTHVRQLAADQAAELARRDRSGPRPGLAAVVRDQVAPAVAAGIAPDSPEAGPVVSGLLSRCADLVDRGELPARLELMNDPRRERYFRLLAVINGWPAPQSLQPVLGWTGPRSTQAGAAHRRRAAAAPARPRRLGPALRTWGEPRYGGALPMPSPAPSDGGEVRSWASAPTGGGGALAVRGLRAVVQRRFRCPRVGTGRETGDQGPESYNDQSPLENWGQFAETIRSESYVKQG
jgi:DNA-binding transcriptional MerR regulator